MEQIKHTIIGLLLILSSTAQCKDKMDTKIDSLTQSFNKSKEVYEKIKELKSNPIKVIVINTCSTKPELCGTMAFASVCLVKVLEGKYFGDTIYVAETCTRTDYSVGQTYILSSSYAPSFSVHLCNGKTYNSDWNYKYDDYLIIFGSLMNVSNIGEIRAN